MFFMALSSVIVIHMEKLLDIHNIVLLLCFESEPLFFSPFIFILKIKIQESECLIMK